MKTYIAFLTATCIGAAPIAVAEVGEKTAEIENASWQAVPETSGTSQEYSEPAYIDVNGISRTDDLVIFDVVNSDASYGRVEGNCLTFQLRSLRWGRFLTKIQVSYIEQNSNGAFIAANPYQLKLLTYACNTPPINTNLQKQIN